MIKAIKNSLKKKLARWGAQFGFEQLTREESVVFLSNYAVATYAGDQIMLPAIHDFTDNSKSLFNPTVAVAESAHVWSYRSDDKEVSLLHCGALFAEGKIVCMDWQDNRYILRDLFSLKKRIIYHADTVIAPWSHYLDGIQFGGYYDYLILVAGKLCRIKESFSADTFSQSVVAYPLFDTPYERELLALIGFRPEQILDSRKTTIRFNNCILGNSGHWFYSHMEDLMALKRQVESSVALGASSQSGERLYISRSGRRRIQNEPELIELLEKYGISVVHDVPRTVAEQVNMYRNASFIIGPHGASFSNILWCRPGTQLVELFSPNYLPGFFLYMAERLGLRYAAYCHGAPGVDRFSKLEEDIFVSIPSLERSLNDFFAEKTSTSA